MTFRRGLLGILGRRDGTFIGNTDEYVFVIGEAIPKLGITVMLMEQADCVLAIGTENVE